jgi:hypothetical protein
MRAQPNFLNPGMGRLWRFDRPVVLLDHVVQILPLTGLDRVLNTPLVAEIGNKSVALGFLFTGSLPKQSNAETF